jgi:NAD(P)-dependent dehydrogenase (short-subunit alcohol dehydrogenase family)
MAAYTVCITGANRGIGFGLVEAYLSRPSITVVGIVRSQDSASSLQDASARIKLGTGSVLHIVQLKISETSGPDSIRETILAATSGPSHVDVLICSAGYSSTMVQTVEVTAEDLRECFEVNTIAPLLMFQAIWPLMINKEKNNSSPPKFVVITSSVGSIGAMEPYPGGAYGPSKAAVNYIAKSLHVQMVDDGLISIALHPGWVQTNMGRAAAKDWNFNDDPPVTVEESVSGILKVIDGATRESVSGKFITQKGEEIPW